MPRLFAVACRKGSVTSRCACSTQISRHVRHPRKCCSMRRRSARRAGRTSSPANSADNNICISGCGQERPCLGFVDNLDLEWESGFGAPKFSLLLLPLALGMLITSPCLLPTGFQAPDRPAFLTGSLWDYVGKSEERLVPLDSFLSA